MTKGFYFKPVNAHSILYVFKYNNLHVVDLIGPSMLKNYSHTINVTTTFINVSKY